VTFFDQTYSFWNNRTNQTLCVHFQISIFNNHPWIIHVFQSFMCLSPFITTDYWEYTVLYDIHNRKWFFRFWTQYTDIFLWQILIDLLFYLLTSFDFKQYTYETVLKTQFLTLIFPTYWKVNINLNSKTV
jgi:hypothetical protein